MPDHADERLREMGYGEDSGRYPTLDDYAEALRIVREAEAIAMTRAAHAQLVAQGRDASRQADTIASVTYNGASIRFNVVHDVQGGMAWVGESQHGLAAPHPAPNHVTQQLADDDNVPVLQWSSTDVQSEARATVTSKHDTSWEVVRTPCPQCGHVGHDFGDGLGCRVCSKMTAARRYGHAPALSKGRRR